MQGGSLQSTQPPTTALQTVDIWSCFDLCTTTRRSICHLMTCSLCLLRLSHSYCLCERMRYVTAHVHNARQGEVATTILILPQLFYLQRLPIFSGPICTAYDDSALRFIAYPTINPVKRRAGLVLGRRFSGYSNLVLHSQRLDGEFDRGSCRQTGTSIRKTNSNRPKTSSSQFSRWSASSLDAQSH